MAEQAAVLWWMVLRQWIDAFFTVAIDAEFFRLLLSHGHEPRMVLVVRQPGGCFRRGTPQKQEQSGAENEEKSIVDYYFFLVVHLVHILLYIIELVERVTLCLSLNGSFGVSQARLADFGQKPSLMDRYYLTS